MKLGLRLQILLLLGGLMLLAFVPLFFAVATYASFTLRQLRTTNAQAVGQAVAARISEARGQRSPPDLLRLLQAQLGRDGVEGILQLDQPGGADLHRPGRYTGTVLYSWKGHRTVLMGKSLPVRFG